MYLYSRVDWPALPDPTARYWEDKEIFREWEYVGAWEECSGKDYEESRREKLILGLLLGFVRYSEI